LLDRFIHVSSPRPTILVIDDEPSVGLLLKYVFSALNVDVEVATTGTDGLRALSERPFEVVYIDFNLPDVAGDEVIVRAKSARPDVPIVVMTAEPEHKVKARHHAVMYLHKPFHLTALEESFNRARGLESAATPAR
jgi:DNA-binding response OmpR family regulator